MFTEKSEVIHEISYDFGSLLVFPLDKSLMVVLVVGLVPDLRFAEPESQFLVDRNRHAHESSLTVQFILQHHKFASPI